MAGPWEKYAAAKAPAGPWEKYAQAPAAQTPDGRRTAPGTTAEQASRVPPGMIYDERTGGYVDTAAEAERMGPGFGAAASVGAGLPFVGEGTDEAIGYLTERGRGVPREIGQEVVRQSREQFQQERPWTATGLEVAGAVAGAAPFVGPAVGAVGRASGTAQKVGLAAAGGAAVGGAEGASQGYLRGRNGGRTESAVRGAGIGAGIGAAAGPIGLAAGAVIENLAPLVRRTDVRVIADEFGVDTRTARLLKNHLLNDDLEKAQELLARAGPDSMLADAGIGTAQALDTAAQSGGSALRIAREAADERAAAAQGKIVSRLDDVLGEPEGRRSATAAINARTASARQSAYDRAYAAPIDYASEQGRRIEGVLERVAPKTMRSAIEEANNAMRDAGVKNQQILAEIADDGSVAFREMPNVQQLDYLKRALDDIARQGRDSITGQMTAGAARAADQAKAIRDALKDAVPDYGRALRLGGDTIRERDALDLGARLLDAKTTVEDVRDFMRNASDADRAAIRQGLRQSLDKRMGDVRATVSDDATAAREAIKATLDTSSRNARAKLALALGPEGNAIRETLDEASAALQLRAAMATNSKTAVRQAGQQAVDEVISPNAIETLLMGKPMEAAQKAAAAASGLADLTPQRREQVLSQVATALTRIRGRDAQRALRTVRKAIAGEPLNAAQARQVAKVVGGTSFIGAYQGLGTQLER